MSRILVADDDDAIREVVAETLHDAGHTVVRAADGVQALEEMGRDWEPPELVLLDLMMPRMDGWEVLRAMESTSRLAGIPVLVLTAFGSRRDLPTNRMVLHKPFEHDLLLCVVDRMLAAGPESEAP